MFENEIWLRHGQPGATMFNIHFDSSNGKSALFKVDIAPSQDIPAMVKKWPSELILWCLRGRGVIETGNGARVVLGAATSLRIPANTLFSWRNELRETFSMLVFMVDGDSVSFLDSLPMCSDDENAILSEASAYDVQLHLPPLVPELSEPIKALENRISVPLHSNFSL